MPFTVTVSNPTGVPGYEPEYAVAAVATWGEAYDYAIGTARAQGEAGRVAFDYARLSQQLRDGATEVTMDVLSAQPYVQLGRPFTPARLATVKVVGR